MSSIGDKALREFAGTLSQFDSVDTLKHLADTVGEAEVARLIDRLNLLKRLPEFEVRGIFLSNAEIDANGEGFLKSFPQIRFIGTSELQSTYVSAERVVPIGRRVEFDVSGFETSKYIVDKDHEAIVAPIKASGLVALDGISNQAIFYFNVRGPLGRTQVNKDIASSINDPSRHKLFPLFHNGITIIAKGLNSTTDAIGIEDYFVVNGCQSLTALYGNRTKITGELRILTKIIKASPASELAEMVTRFSNNQNGIKARDFKSNNQIQIRLQNEFQSQYGREFFYEIKRGEDNRGLEVISNETAGLYLMAFDLKQPWGTHRKYQVFEDRHSDLFGRPSVNAHRIVFCHLLANQILKATANLENLLFARYVLTKYLILYILRLIFETDEIGNQSIQYPNQFTTDRANRTALISAVDALLNEVTTDLNAELKDAGEDFDYRGKLRDDAWCKKLANDIVGTHQKLVSRRRIESLSVMFQQALDAQGSTPATV